MKVCKGNYQPTTSIKKLYRDTCVQCGIQSDELWIHHINGNRKDNRTSNLVPLCMRCHRAGHTGRVDLSWLKSLPGLYTC